MRRKTPTSPDPEARPSVSASARRRLLSSLTEIACEKLLVMTVDADVVVAGVVEVRVDSVVKAVDEVEVVAEATVVEATEAMVDTVAAVVVVAASPALLPTSRIPALSRH